MNKFIRLDIIKSMIKKEFKQMLRDKRMRGVLFGTPILMLLIFGYAVNTDVDNVTMAVLDSDKTALSRSIIEKFTASKYFKLYAYLNSEKELEYLMNSAEVELFIHIERGLSKRIKSGKEASIQIITDGTNSSRASVIAAYVNEIINTLFFEKYRDRIKTKIIQRLFSNQVTNDMNSIGFKIKKGMQLKERVFFNQDLSSRNFFLPGIIGLLISLITIMLTSMSIVKEREAGTIEQIIVSPIKPLEYILGKTIPFAIIGFVDMCVVTAIAIFWFAVPFKGNFIFLLFSSLLYIISTLSIGLYISTISRTQQQAMLSFFLFFMPAILFSGFVFPIYTMPETIQVITYLNPLMYFMTIIREIFLKGTGITILWKQVFALFLIGIILISLSTRRFSKRLE